MFSELPNRSFPRYAKFACFKLIRTTVELTFLSHTFDRFSGDVGHVAEDREYDEARHEGGPAVDQTGDNRVSANTSKHSTPHN